MTKRLLGLIAWFGLSAAAFAQGQGPQGPFPLNAISGPGSCATIAVDPKSTSGVYINVGPTAFVGTLQPQVIVAAQAPVNTQVTPAGSTTYQSSITANGGYNAPVAGPPPP